MEINVMEHPGTLWVMPETGNFKQLCSTNQRDFLSDFPRPVMISLIEGKSRPIECDFESGSD